MKSAVEVLAEVRKGIQSTRKYKETQESASERRERGTMALDYGCRSVNGKVLDDISSASNDIAVLREEP